VIYVGLLSQHQEGTRMDKQRTEQGNLQTAAAGENTAVEKGGRRRIIPFLKPNDCPKELHKPERASRGGEAALIQDYLLTGNTDRIKRLSKSRLTRDNVRDWKEKVDRIEVLLRRLPNTRQTSTRKQMANKLAAQVLIYFKERQLDHYHKLYQEIYESRANFNPLLWLDGLKHPWILENLHEIINRQANTEPFVVD
jgi:hypothetical protein